MIHIQAGESMSNIELNFAQDIFQIMLEGNTVYDT